MRLTQAQASLTLIWPVLNKTSNKSWTEGAGDEQHESKFGRCTTEALRQHFDNGELVSTYFLGMTISRVLIRG